VRSGISGELFSLDHGTRSKRFNNWPELKNAMASFCTGNTWPSLLLCVRWNIVEWTKFNGRKRDGYSRET
jgi:hypothetical protein